MGFVAELCQCIGLTATGATFDIFVLPGRRSILDWYICFYFQTQLNFRTMFSSRLF